tara:strand:- start:101 stop:1558 length:1458 start_codon:yes stop_codon:yes gene_type:complete
MDDYNKQALKAVDLQKKNKSQEAKKIYIDLLKIKRNPQILRLLGLIEFDEKKYEKSLKLLNESIQINPNDSECYSNRGVVNFKLRNIEEAISDYKKAISIDKNNYNAFFNLGNLYKKIDRFDESIENFNKAILINKNHYNAYHNRAVVKRLLSKFGDAIKDFDEALRINPKYSNSLFFKAITQLKIGDYENGWKNYEHRWETTNFPSPKKEFKQPLWNGKDDLNNKVILIHGEQGLGDNIHFVRYFNLIRSKAKKAILQVDKKLVYLFKECNFNDYIFSNDEKLPEFDIHCPLLSLPFKFSTTLENIPFNEKYIFPNKDRIIKWKKTFDNQYLNIGINWQASLNPDLDKGRSFKLKYFYEISMMDKIKLYSLQKINGLNQLNEISKQFQLNVIDDFDEEAPFVDTAAIIENLDLVITCDTSIAHLSGAIGKKTFLLLQKNCEWRWLCDIDYSPWYNSMKIYRQKKQDDWSTVFDEVKKDIKRLTN